MTKTGRRQLDRLLLTDKEFGHQFLANKDIFVPSLTAVPTKEHRKWSDGEANSFRNFISKVLDQKAPRFEVDGAVDGASGRLNESDGKVVEHESLRWVVT